MNLKYIFLPVVLLGVCSFGCATATGPLFTETSPQEHKGKAVVYSYMLQPPILSWGAPPYALKINGETIMPLLNKGYYQLILDPGTYDFELFQYGHTFWPYRRNVPYEKYIMRAENMFLFEGDKTYYVRFWDVVACEEVGLLDFFGGQPTPILDFGITLIPKDEALEALKYCRLIDTASTYADSRPTIEPLTPAELSTQVKRTNESFIDPVSGMEFVLVKGGCYQRGDMIGRDTSKGPMNEVCVNDFYIGKFEVTQGQWKTLMGNNPSHFNTCGDDCPVEQISWDEAQDFIRIMNQRSGKNYRLLTEDEWEYAARSGGKNEKWAGVEHDSQAELWYRAWYQENSACRTHPVGRKKPNELGIYDMSGNVWEWAQDIYIDSKYSYYGKGKDRAIRGGSWAHNLYLARTTSRYGYWPDEKEWWVGFRVGRTP